MFGGQTRSYLKEMVILLVFTWEYNWLRRNTGKRDPEDDAGGAGDDAGGDGELHKHKQLPIPRETQYNKRGC
jgi:hypothetical protein